MDFYRLVLFLLLSGLTGCGIANEVRSLYDNYAPTEWRVTFYHLHYNWQSAPIFRKEALPSPAYEGKI